MGNRKKTELGQWLKTATGRSKARRAFHDINRRPEVLLCPNVPKPLHGLAPRVVLGTKWWNETRQAAYRATDYHCITCGVWKYDARGPKWLEGHEVYEVDYAQGRSVYIETVALCHYCHNYIHDGRMQALVEKGRMPASKYVSIIIHGDAILRAAGLVVPPPYEGLMAEWGDWRLVVYGKEYEPIYETFEQWCAAHAD